MGKPDVYTSWEPESSLPPVAIDKYKKGLVAESVQKENISMDTRPTPSLLKKKPVKHYNQQPRNLILNALLLVALVGR